MAPAQQSIRCQCGTVRGTVAQATPQGGNRVVCYCASCRAGALYCGAPPPMTEGVDIFQTTADRITITAGKEHLIPFSFGPNNLLRWKADCCGVQMFSTPRNPKIPLVGVMAQRFDDPDALGPVKSRAFVPKANGKTGHENLPALLGAMVRVLTARLSGRWRKTPLFDLSGPETINPVTLVSRDARRALLETTS